MQHRAGPYAGLHQILGLWHGPIPDTLQPVTWLPDNRVEEALLAKVTDRYVLWVERTDVGRVGAAARASIRRPCDSPGFCNVAPNFDKCEACRQ